ncbi:MULTISPECIES: DCC1-like thiol-disulfide oxidoreductase family protein [unclassified Roseofilum]|uniref:DCC1-like thiol-disulfide oxidoreductase family protein n=1 Tax=unclassified Roseofilum TaxID=2620099 RepID=UPI000E923AD9|nr:MULTISPECIES: HTTM domain-containing protein [unclassified Roseofilum]MBP0008342.1 HTTM domain-containing protein [Roseofilum sp. Belize Diploria]MBP0035031.1 HTTM domain-containing protein [Roseofilum sp. Belize BBD 4]HBQ99665.1 hypothetical protein [Cyanobacteria bacterium UBA11691]
MVSESKSVLSPWRNKLEQIFGLDLRSFALFRIGLSLVLIADLLIRSRDIRDLYSNEGVLPTPVLFELLKPGYWSIHALSGQTIVQALLFSFALLMALGMLVGYRTRLATIASWALLISLHNRHPFVIFAADDVIRALMFWAMFLPLGATYSIDSALNSSREKLPKRILTGATFALHFQQCYIYMFSAAFKVSSSIWFPDGDAVYYAFSFDQYATPVAEWGLNFPPLMTLATHATLVIEWLGPLLLFVPFRTPIVRTLTVITFILLHISFGLGFEIGIFPFLSSASWLVFLPSEFWDYLEKRVATPQRMGLKIYYDAECGFCKKVVYLLRTFLVLPSTTPLTCAQNEPSIYADMEAYNSWVVVDWQEKRRFKWDAIAYVVSLSPIFKPFARVLRWKPLMNLGNKLYETIANNRKFAGKFTAPFKFRPLVVRPSSFFSIVAILLFAYTTFWNVKKLANRTLSREHVINRILSKRTFQRIEGFGGLTRLDQGWSIFAPSPPKDDGWHVIQGKLKDGTPVDLLNRTTGEVTWEKPTLKQRNRWYPNMQWRTYYINLNRSIGKRLYPYFGDYLCQTWNQNHTGEQEMDQITVYFMNERTVPPGEDQTVEQTTHWDQSCSNE